MFLRCCLASDNLPKTVKQAEHSYLFIIALCFVLIWQRNVSNLEKVLWHISHSNFTVILAVAGGSFLCVLFMLTILV